MMTYSINSQFWNLFWTVAAGFPGIAIVCGVLASGVSGRLPESPMGRLIGAMFGGAIFLVTSVGMAWRIHEVRISGIGRIELARTITTTGFAALEVRQLEGTYQRGYDNVQEWKLHIIWASGKATVEEFPLCAGLRQPDRSPQPGGGDHRYLADECAGTSAFAPGSGRTKEVTVTISIPEHPEMSHYDIRSRPGAFAWSALLITIGSLSFVIPVAADVGRPGLLGLAFGLVFLVGGIWTTRTVCGIQLRLDGMVEFHRAIGATSIPARDIRVLEGKLVSGYDGKEWKLFVRHANGTVQLDQFDNARRFADRVREFNPHAGIVGTWPMGPP